MVQVEIRQHPPDDPTAYAVEWHRPDPRKGLYRAWLLGASLLVAGAVGLALTINEATELDPAVRFVVVIGSVILSASGPIHVMWTAIRSLADDTCLVLRNDGLYFTGTDRSFFVRWQDVVATEFDAESDSLRIVTETEVLAIPRPRFLGYDAEALAARVDDIRRRALLGLIRPANVWGWEEGRH